MSRRDSVAALGTDPIPRLLARNSVQTTLSVATYGVYALTNAFFVSRWVGPVALASVNVAAPCCFLSVRWRRRSERAGPRCCRGRSAPVI